MGGPLQNSEEGEEGLRHKHPVLLPDSSEGGIEMLEFLMKLWGFRTRRNQSSVLHTTEFESSDP